MKKLVTEYGEEHGLINELSNKVADDGFKYMDEETKKKATALKKEEKRIVKAQYINMRGDSERLDKVYMHYAGERIQCWHFIPGYIYEVPFGLINDVNDPHCFLPKRSEILDADGVPTRKEGRAQQLHKFVAVGF